MAGMFITLYRCSIRGTLHLSVLNTEQPSIHIALNCREAVLQLSESDSKRGGSEITREHYTACRGQSITRSASAAFLWRRCNISGLLACSPGGFSWDERIVPAVAMLPKMPCSVLLGPESKHIFEPRKKVRTQTNKQLDLVCCFTVPTHRKCLPAMVRHAVFQGLG
ncbi:uncharacterized protein BDV14DRAFT_46967 [Aspergillus stella-maris]|uniref:uncharacterized protein n=1 Tax=Aspergillus stella-maris TaxID=1810926 RepID=UPI003CCCB7CD